MLPNTLRNSLLLAVGVALVLGGFEETITFTVFTENGVQFVSSFDDNSTQQRCNSSEKYAIIVHGWLESISTDWVHELVENLLRHRGGCIIFMDYSNHSIVQEYFTLVRKFDEISHVLLEKLHHLEAQGFDPDNLFMYGFSFGAQLAINAGNLYGEARVAEIDGPGFTFSPNIIPTRAAKNVQCVHTSIAKGTMKRNCHQDWLMGRCGRAQEAAGPAPRGSHGLCPHFYNSAFTHDFIATDNIFHCISQRMALNIPEHFKMGYMETRKREVFGDLFSPTGECFPFNNYTVEPMERGFGRFARLRQSRRMMRTRTRTKSC